MSQKIMKGIEEAQKDIHKEKQKKDEEVEFMQRYVANHTVPSPPPSMQQGFLHSIPVVGSLWGWLAPPTPTTPEGRTFNLAQGACVCAGRGVF